MNADYAGTIAAIGDKSTGKNHITPEFDAKIYKSIINRNGILSGFELEGNTLKAGVCIAFGYRGGIRRNATIENPEQVSIYGMFTVHHNKNVVDDFHILVTKNKEVLPPEGTVGQKYTEQNQVGTSSDLLTNPGTYALPLYIKGQPVQEVDKATKNINGSYVLTPDESLTVDNGDGTDTIYYTCNVSENYSNGYIPQSIEIDDEAVHFQDVRLYDNVLTKRLSFTLVYALVIPSNQVTIPVPKEFELSIVITSLITTGTFLGDFYERNKEYPKYCEHADYAKVITSNGTLGVGTTAETQPVTDKSDKVATTEFLHNLIEEYIDPDVQTVKIHWKDGSTVDINVKLKRKSKKVIVETLDSSAFRSLGGSSTGIEDYYLPIPEGFRPPHHVMIGLFDYSSTAEQTSILFLDLPAGADKAICKSYGGAIATGDYVSNMQSGYELE